ncbi:MAG: DUF2341 domain-containing protein [Pseudobdellovibrionaceae bacterium]|nr:DUF2341 domain-containing protein [Bdellovibrionales bacterium]USN46092.1 MAG: DUF2341 domain-containing protein [Pseudobdellovibrionaceae bacterium]
MAALISGLLLVLIVGCGQFPTDTGLRASNALCSGVNPVKPLPGLPTLLNNIFYPMAGIQDPSEDCDFTYRRTITLDTATDQDDKQVKIIIDSSNFDYANALSDGADLRFLDQSYNIFDHWIEVWDTTGTSIVWVRVPTSGTDEFFMHYGNTSATDASDAGATFSYTSARAIYWELQNSGTHTKSMASYSQANTVTVQTSGGPSTVVIGKNSVGAVASAIQGAISVTGAISGRALDSGGGRDTISALTLRGQIFGYPISRGTDRWEILNPGTADANISITNYNGSGGLLGTTNTVITAGQLLEVAADVTFGILESDQNILAGYSVNNATDGMTLVPASTQLVGVNSNTGSLGVTQDGTTGTIYYSTGAIVPFSGDRGDSITVNVGTATQGQAAAVNIIANQPIVAVAQADSDGSDTCSFWPPSEFSRDYVLPADSQYIAAATLYDSTITVYNADTTVYGSCTATSDGLTPHKCWFGRTGSGIEFNAGTRISSDKPFYIYYEYSDQDETNILGPKQGRLLSDIEPVATVGPEYEVY